MNTVINYSGEINITKEIYLQLRKSELCALCPNRMDVEDRFG